MIKSMRFLFLIFVTVGSLVLGPVTPAYALTYPADINKSFTPISIRSGGTSRLRVTVYNPNANPLTSVAWLDDLIAVQPGLSFANPPNVVQTCAGTVTDGSGGTVDAGDTSLRLTGGTVPRLAGGKPGSCYVEVSVTSTTPGNLINTIPVSALTSFVIDPEDTPPLTPVAITNSTPASATLNVIAVQPPSLSKGFAPNTIFVGQLSTLTITIHNNDRAASLTNTTFTDNLPVGVVVSTPLAATLTGCGAGTLRGGGGLPLAAGDTSILLNNGTIAKNSDCVITVGVTSALEDAYTNTIPSGPPGSGSIQTLQGVTNASPAVANLNVQAFNLSKAFSPSTIAVGETSQLTITIQNPANFTYTGVSITDNLPANIEIASPVTSSLVGCGSGTLTDGGGGALGAGDLSVRMTGGDIAPISTCTITVNVTAAMDAPEATYTNTIPTGALVTDQGNSNHAPATANLAVEGLEIAKVFAPATFAAGTTSTLTITLRNPSSNPFTVSTTTPFSDTLPILPNTNLTVVLGSAATTCAGGVASATAPRTVTLTGGTIPFGSIAVPGTCTITVDVTTAANAPEATYINTIPIGALTTDEGGTNSTQATAPVTVTTVSVTKAFSTSPIVAGQNSTVTIRINNPATGGALTGINITDTLPLGLTVIGAPASPQCNGGVVTSIASTAIVPGSVTLAGGSLAAGSSSCTLVFNVTALASASSGIYTNTINPGDLDTDQGPTNSNDPSADIVVNAVNLTKAFAPISIQSGGTSTLTITLQNPTGFAYTDVNFTDTLPANLSVAASPAPINNCSGALADGSGGTLDPGDTSIRLIGGTIPASATPPTINTCTIIVPVTGTIAASYTNTIPVGGLTTSQGPLNPTNVTANLTVYTTGAGVTLTKAFQTSPINIGQNSRLRLTITAPADTNLTSFFITDPLPGDVRVSNSTLPTITGCGAGVVYPSANFNPLVGDAAITLTGGTVTRGTNCVITVYVTSNTGSTAGVVNTNTINPGNINNDQNRSIPNPVIANLTVRTVSTLTTAKAFYPSIINPGGLSTLTITLTNTSTTPLVNVLLTDNLPNTAANDIFVAPIPNASTTCAPGVVTADAGTQIITLTNGTIPAQSSGGTPGICTITVNVRGVHNSGGLPVTQTNTIPTGNVIGTIQGTSSTMNAQANSTAQLTMQNLSIEIVKGFEPQLVYGGAVSTLGITLRNPNTAAVLTGITFTDTMPAGMIIADPPLFTPSAVGDCGPGATITGISGTNTFTFSGGTLAADAECTMSLSATMTVNSNLTNTIPAGAVSTFNGVTNGTATSASLTNQAGASISKSFAPNPVASGLSNYSILTITIRSTANVALTGLGLVDTLPAGLQVAGGSAPLPSHNCGVSATLLAAPGATSIQLSGGLMPIGFSLCTITVPVTGANPGVYTNTIPPGSITNNEDVSNETPAVDILTLTPFSLGNRVWYDTDNNGIVDGAEVGIPNVRVQLYRDDGATPGVFDSGDTPLPGFETTDATGYYRFDNLGPDDYIVTIPADNFRNVGGGDTVPGDPLAGYLSSGSALAANGSISDSFSPDPDTTATDNDDNGASTFVSNSLDYVAAQAVTIGPGATEPTDDADPLPNPGTGEAVNNQSDRTVDFGFYRQQLSNQIFTDLDNNGVFGGADTPLAGAIVQLYAGDGTTEIRVGPDGILGTADDATGGVTTGAGGTYLFSGLPAGDYIVRVTPPSGYSTIDNGTPAASSDSANPNDNLDNNDNGLGVNPGQVSSAVVTLTPGVSGVSTTVDNSTATTLNPSLDFGFVPLYSLGNRVWFDTDNNSAINGAEVGINNVRVELYQDNGNGVYDAGDIPLGFDTTDASGYYRFDNLNPGNYVVLIPNSQFSTGGALDRYWSSGTNIANNGTVTDATANDPDVDIDDSDDNGITTLTGNAINYVSSQAITLGPGVSEPTNDNDPATNPEPGEAPNDQSNRTVDFGFYRVELSNQIFWDLSADGIFGAGDVVLPDAVVKLYTGDGATEILVGLDGILGTADDAAGGVTSDSVDGTYLFSGLPAGNYIVRVTPPAGFESTVDSADTATPNSNIDNNDNGVGVAAGEVSSNQVALVPGVVDVSNVVTNSAGSTLNPSLDFGFVADSTLEFSLGNRVWFDTDNDGTINGSEVGVANVRVDLYIDNGGTAGVYDAGDTFVSFDNTDPTGYYRFDNLAAGNYVVRILPSQFDSGGPLDGYWSSGTNILSNGTVTDSIGPGPDNNVDSDDNGATSFVSNTVDYVSSRAVTLGPSTNEPIDDTDPLTNPEAGEEPNNQSNRTVDFGFYRIQLSDQIFVDVNNDGVYNSGDSALVGARVQLYASNGTTEINVGPDGILGTLDDGPNGMVTGVDGLYLFSGLPAGDYIVRVTPPAGYASTVDVNADTTTPNNNVNNNDNGIGVGTGQVSSNPVSLVPGVSGASTTVINSTGTTHNPSMDFGFNATNGFLKTILSTSETFTSGVDAAIGEIVTYQITVDLAAGIALNNVVVTDRMDRGLAFVDCLLVNAAGTDLTGTVCPSVVVSSITDPGDLAGNPANPGRQVVFNIGNIAAPATDSTLVLQYRAIVLDVIENQSGGALNNSATVTWSGGSLSSSAPNVNIVEPDLAIDKSATPSTGVPIGTPIQFTLTINHTSPQSTADAFDVVLTDILPSTLEYIPCSVTYTGWVPTSPAAPAYCPGATNTLTFTWDTFPRGQVAVINFSARLVGTPATNSASVFWTSLDIDPGAGGLPQQLSVHNPESTERWYDPTDNVNVYSVSDSVIINAPDADETAGSASATKLPVILPATGFAPGVITSLPEQPADKSYAATDVWMEIPSQGIKMPIVGIPLVDGDWDLSWLSQEAGWLNGTAFPGWEGNSGLTGHVTLPNGKPGPFASLSSLKWGDKIIIHAYGEMYIYEVRENRTIKPYSTSVLKHEDDAWLTLITCKTYIESTNTYADRTAVRAVLVKVQVDTAASGLDRR